MALYGCIHPPPSFLVLPREEGKESAVVSYHYLDGKQKWKKVLRFAPNDCTVSMTAAEQ